jgi:hypothetical protein
VTPTPDQLTDQLMAALIDFWEADAGEPIRDLPETHEMAAAYAAALAPLVETLLADARTDGFRHGYTAGRTLTRQHQP